MKRILLTSLALLLAILACGQPALNNNTHPDSDVWATFSEGDFKVDLPTNWEEEKSADAQVIYAVSDGIASVWIKSWPLIPSLVANSVHEWAAGTEMASLLSESGNAKKNSPGIRDHRK